MGHKLGDLIRREEVTVLAGMTGLRAAFASGRGFWRAGWCIRLITRRGPRGVAEVLAQARR